jgi:cyclophilin family peptidyl-prolyl cis-trans isomerase
MATEKKTISKRQAVKAEMKAKNTQIAAVAFFVIVLALIAWIGFRPRSSSPTSEPAGQAPAPTAQAQQPLQFKQYDAPPALSIDKTKRYLATFKMAKGGQFVIELYPEKAPITVNSFVFLARAGFYDGTTFHRVLPGFMAQGGDPTGTGGGGPGYEFVNEDSDLTFDKAGVLAMANAGRDTNGSQFFITFGPQEFLNGGYTIFGQVVDGLDTVLNIRLRDPQEFPDYLGDVLESVTITEE